MHKQQKLTVLAAVVIVFMMAVCPPWVYIDDEYVEHQMGYSPIWSPAVERQRGTAELYGIVFPLDVTTRTANEIDLTKLMLQIALVLALAGSTLVMTRRLNAAV